MCRQASGKSSLDNNYSIEEEVGSIRSGHSLDEDQTGALLATQAGSVEYTPIRHTCR